MTWAVWATLALFVILPGAALCFLALRALELWRGLRSVKGETVDALAALETRANAAAEKVERSGDSPELDRSLTRLHESIRRLNILRSALDDATGAVGRITAVYPRK